MKDHITYKEIDTNETATLESENEGVPEQRRVPWKYEETTLLSHTYFNDFNIWEALIRKGLITGKVEINEDQVNRLCNPVLEDNNNSLVHHMSQHNIKNLYKIFQKTQIGDTYNLKSKRFPIFLNFDGKSQLDLALKASDIESFKFLIVQLIQIQNGFESSHLVDSWLV